MMIVEIKFKNKDIEIRENVKICEYKQNKWIELTEIYKDKTYTACYGLDDISEISIKE